MTYKTLRVVEFLVIGLLMNTIDNLVAVKYGAGAPIDLEVLGRIILLVTPFAILSELIVDNPSFWKRVMKFLKVELKKVEKKIGEEIF